MASRSIHRLHPQVAELARSLVRRAVGEGIVLLITCTLRTFEDQAELYARGRTTGGDIVTNARPGESWHNFGLAFDVVPVAHGRAVWDSLRWGEIGAMGKAIGLEWGGDFACLKDMPHFEYHPGLTIAAAHQRQANGEALLA